MRYSKKDVIVGFIIIATLVAGFLIYKKVKTPEPLPTRSPVSVEYRKDFEDSFKLEIPENTSLVELKDVNGGDSRGIVTKTEILVDANNPEIGYFYQAWLEDIDTNTLFSLGKLNMAKGGWMLEYEFSDNSQGKVVVSLEKVFDSNLEQKVLEGSF